MTFRQSMGVIACSLMMQSTVVFGLDLGMEGFEHLDSLVQPSYAPSKDSTEGGLWMVMEKAEDTVKRHPQRVRDKALEAYLGSLICRLAESHCEGIRVYVMRVPHFNANMAPNGMMQVWTGLLLRARSEEELVAVLGHEIGHFLRRHSLNQFENIKNTATFASLLSLGLAGAVATGNMNPDIGRTAIDLSQLGLMAGIFSYNRNQESEADRYGVQLMAASGYKTLQASNIWRHVIDEEEASTEKTRSRSIFFASHPAPDDRIEALQGYAEVLDKDKADSVVSDDSEFRSHVTRLLPMLLDDQLNLNNFGRSEFVLKGLLDEKLAPGMVNYYLGELYRRRCDDNDVDEAEQFYMASLAAGEPPAEVYRALGLKHVKAREMDKAKEYLEQYLAKKPDAHDREMITMYMSWGDQ